MVKVAKNTMKKGLSFHPEWDNETKRTPLFVPELYCTYKYYFLYAVYYNDTLFMFNSTQRFHRTCFF